MASLRFLSALLKISPLHVRTHARSFTRSFERCRSSGDSCARVVRGTCGTVLRDLGNCWYHTTRPQKSGYFSAEKHQYFRTISAHSAENRRICRRDRRQCRRRNSRNRRKESTPCFWDHLVAAKALRYVSSHAN